MSVSARFLEGRDVPHLVAVWFDLGKGQRLLCLERPVEDDRGRRYVVTWLPEVTAVAVPGLSDGMLPHCDLVSAVLAVNGLDNAVVDQRVQSTSGMMFAGNYTNPYLRAVEYMKGVEAMRLVVTRVAGPGGLVMAVERFTTEPLFAAPPVSSEQALRNVLALNKKFSA